MRSLLDGAFSPMKAAHQNPAKTRRHSGLIRGAANSAGQDAGNFRKMSWSQVNAAKPGQERWRWEDGFCGHRLHQSPRIVADRRPNTGGILPLWLLRPQALFGQHVGGGIWRVFEPSNSLSDEPLSLACVSGKGDHRCHRILTEKTKLRTKSG